MPHGSCAISRMQSVQPAYRDKRLLTTLVIRRLGSALLLPLGWSGWTVTGRPCRLTVAQGRSLLLRSLIGLRPRLRPGHRRAGLRFWPVIGWGLWTRRGAIRGWPRPGGWRALPLPWPLALSRPWPVDRPRWRPVRHRAAVPGVALAVERPAPVVIVPVRADHETDDGDADLCTVGRQQNGLILILVLNEVAGHPTAATRGG